MKFIRFGAYILNLDQVVAFDYTEGRIIEAITIGNRFDCVLKTEKEAKSSFEGLSAYLVDEKHLTTKSGGEPKSRVMTASEAVNIPDIVGKRVMVEAVVEDIEYYHPDNLFCVQLEFDFKHEKFTKWVHKSTLIEVLG